MTLHSRKTNSKTRLLLILWQMNAHQEAVKRGDLSKRVTKKQEKAGDYQEIFYELEQAGAVAFPQKNWVSLNAEVGVPMLKQGLQDTDFEFDGNVVAAKTVNTLLDWIRHTDGTGKEEPNPANTISSYDEFVKVALDTYDRLNRDYNFDNLVPIYRIRREIGGRVARSQFNKWMLEMQDQDWLELIGGEVLNAPADQFEDAIKTEIGGLRYYAKRLKNT